MRWALEGVISLSGALSSELNISLLLRMCIFAFLGLWRHATQALELKRSIPTRKRRLFPTLSWCSLRSFSMASSAFRFAVSSSVLFFSRMLRSLLRDVIYEHTKRITIGFSRDGWSRKTFHNLIQSALYRRDKVSWCPLKPKDFFGEGSASTLCQGDPWWRVQNVTSAPTLMARVNTLVWVYTRTHETKAWQERITDLFFVLFRHGFHLFLCSTPRLL